MRKIVFLSFVLLTYLSLAQRTGDRYTQANSTKQAKLYYYYDGVSGFAAKDSQGNMVGFLVELMDQFESYVKTNTGISINAQYVEVPNNDFDLFMQNVKNSRGGVFGLSAVSITEERLADYRFSPAYMKSLSVLITNNKVPTLINISDIQTRFAGKKAVTVGGSQYEERLSEIKAENFPSMEIISVASENEMLQQLGSSDNLFAIIDLNFYLDALKGGLPIKRHPAGDKGGDEFGVIMPKSNDWEPLLKRFFESGFIGGPEHKKLVTKHMGKGALRLVDDL